MAWFDQHGLLGGVRRRPACEWGNGEEPHGGRSRRAAGLDLIVRRHLVLIVRRHFLSRVKGNALTAQAVLQLFGQSGKFAL